MSFTKMKKNSSLNSFKQIDEKIKEAIQGDCTRYAPGIEIISVRVTKPSIPATIKRNFEQMEEERTKVTVIIIYLLKHYHHLWPFSLFLFLAGKLNF